MGNSHLGFTPQAPLNHSGVCLCDLMFGQVQACVNLGVAQLQQESFSQTLRPKSPLRPSSRDIRYYSTLSTCPRHISGNTLNQNRASRLRGAIAPRPLTRPSKWRRRAKNRAPSIFFFFIKKMKMQGKWPISTAVVHRYAWVEVKRFDLRELP